MGAIKSLLDIFLHMDKSLGNVIDTYHGGTYLILFLIVFAETGLVVIPFLPGDSLLFAAGAFAGLGKLQLAYLLLLFFCAALLGDNLNYAIGKFIGPRLFHNENSKLFKRAHLEKTHKFYEKYGGKTVILARFVPIVRTFSPFVAGIGSMRYREFIGFSVAGAALWVGICSSAGYFFGSREIVKKNFSLVVLMIVAISLLPMLIEFLKHRAEEKNRIARETVVLPDK